MRERGSVAGSAGLAQRHRAQLTAHEGCRIVHDVLNRAKQHTARSAGRVIDAFALLRVEYLNHHSHDAARGVEFASLVAAGHVGELADQVLVCVAEYIGADCGVPESNVREPLDQILEQFVREFFPVAPVGGAETRKSVPGLAHSISCIARWSAALTFVAVSRTSFQ